MSEKIYKNEWANNYTNVLVDIIKCYYYSVPISILRKTYNVNIKFRDEIKRTASECGQ